MQLKMTLNTVRIMRRCAFLGVVLGLLVLGTYLEVRQRRQAEQQIAKIKELEAKLRSPSPEQSQPQSPSGGEGLADRVATVARENHSGNSLASRASSQSGSLKDQVFCAQQAEHTFQSDQRKANLTGLIESHFVSHFKPSSNRCFVEIETSLISNGKITEQRYVSDAISGDLLGMYSTIADEPGRPPLWCDMIDDSGNTKHCHSDDEFTELARQYMK